MNSRKEKFALRCVIYFTYEGINVKFCMGKMHLLTFLRRVRW